MLDRMARRWSFALLALILFLGLLEVRAFRYGRVPPRPASRAALHPVFDEAALAGRLGAAIRFPTVTGDDAALEAFLADLAATYPDVHARLACERVGWSLLFTWRGSDPSLAPAALLAHLDVVPAEASRWTVPPFEGRIQGGFVWGRGTLDDKVAVLGILEAATALMKEGYAPKRTLIFAFGQDEETGGHAGAASLAALLKTRRLRLDSVLDEGEVVGEGLVPGVDAPVAFLGTAEKGYLSLALTATGPGGHSSMPGPGDPIARLSRALARLDAHPFPARFTEPVDGMFRALAPRMGHAQRLALANRWLSEPLLARMLSGSAATNALIRTTAAPTLIEGGDRENELPLRARAVLNLRLLPGDDVAGVIEQVRAALADPGIAIEELRASTLEPSSVSGSDDPAYGDLVASIQDAFPDALIAPSLVLGGTDSAHYAGLARQTYRFLPVRVGPEDLGRFHGNDERLRTKDYADAVRFYASYLQNAGR